MWTPCQGHVKKKGVLRNRKADWLSEQIIPEFCRGHLPQAGLRPPVVVIVDAVNDFRGSPSPLECRSMNLSMKALVNDTCLGVADLTQGLDRSSETCSSVKRMPTIRKPPMKV